MLAHLSRAQRSLFHWQQEERAGAYTQPIATEANPLLFLSAGEASGDAYGAALLTALRQRLPAARFTGLGGIAMERAGQQRLVRAEDVAHMGITEVLAHAPFIWRQYRRLVRAIRRERPAIAVLIDFPDVNFRLARHLHRAGVPVVWLVSPQLWAWKRSRLRWVQQRVSKMLVIFPFEEPFYQARGVDAEFIGHPLAGHAPLTSTREAYARNHALDPARTWIALLPGSRWREVRAHLPAMHELAMSDLIASSAEGTVFDGHTTTAPVDPAARTRYEFLLPVASTIDPARLRQMLDRLNADHLRYFGPEAAGLRLTLVPDAWEALRHARASVVASGTATVLAALAGNPFVVVYRVSALTFALARRLVHYPREVPAQVDAAGNLPVCMVNLVAGRRVVPELLQQRCTAANIALELSRLLPDGPDRTAQIDGLAAVRQRLTGSSPPIERAAEVVLHLLSTR